MVAKKQFKITKKTKLCTIMQKKPEAAETLMKEGMFCFGCPMAMQETLEQGCKAHGISDKKIERLIEKINKKESK